MTEKIINNTLSDKLKEKVGHRIPDDFDLSVIGKIDLREAEKIANEEIVFLSEEDLIDGLEDFELIPVKFSGKEEPIPVLNSEIKDDLTDVVVFDSTADLQNSDEVLFEDFNIDKEPSESVSAGTDISETNSYNDSFNQPENIIEEKTAFDAQRKRS